MSEPPPFEPSRIEPLRVEALQYQTPTTGPVRPGIVVAVGIISIVLGSLSILTSGSGVMMSILYASMRGGFASAMAGTNVHISDTHALSIPDMMAPQARAIAITGMTRNTPLTPPRSQMLDRLLAQVGDQMFPFADATLTEDKVAASVSASGKTTDPTGNELQYFVIANGRIEIGNDQASFSPTRGIAVQVYRDDTTAFTTTASSSAATMPTLPPFFTRGPTSTKPFVLYGLASGVNLLLALFLLVIGILTLTRYRRARGLHLFYAFLKIPAAVVAGLAYMTMMAEVMGGLAGSASGVLQVYYIMQSLLACIYPIALFIVMNLRSVKDYYNSIAK